MSTVILFCWLLVSSVVGAMILSVVAGMAEHRKDMSFWNRTTLLVYPCGVILAMSLGLLKLVNWIIGN